MKQISIQIENYNKRENINADIICIESLNGLIEIVSRTLVSVSYKNIEVNIRFDWKVENEIDESNFLFIPETNVLFFRSENQWGAIDIESKALIRHESAIEPFIDRMDDYVLIVGDLEAESTKLDANKIHSVPIDPPTESKDFEDRIEFNSPTFGHQILKLR